MPGGVGKLLSCRLLPTPKLTVYWKICRQEPRRSLTWPEGQPLTEIRAGSEGRGGGFVKLKVG